MMTSLHPPTVHIVDDDAEMTASVRWLLESVSINAVGYSSADHFLKSYSATGPGCFLFDVRIPGSSGLDLYDRLRQRGDSLPVIFMTAYADVPMAVRAMQSGAVDFIEKPFNRHELLEKIQRAVRQNLNHWEQDSERKRLRQQFARITSSERLVLERLQIGRSNREIAEEIGITVRAVEMRRSNLMKKLGANSLAELLRMSWMLEGAGAS